MEGRSYAHYAAAAADRGENREPPACVTRAGKDGMMIVTDDASSTPLLEWFDSYHNAASEYWRGLPHRSRGVFGTHSAKHGAAGD